VITDYNLPARYYYSVWMRHLVMAHKNGLRVLPDSVAELGPGQSVGIGIAALLSGASSYYALDIVEFASDDNNIKIFHELLDLFKNRADIPDNNEFKSVEPYLESYEFPDDILRKDHLEISLNGARIEAIENAVKNIGRDSDSKIEISYMAPWDDRRIIKAGTVDLLISQAVLEHVDDLSGAYQSMYRWLKPGGFISHSIDFRSHGVADDWNGYWTYSDWVWKIIRGRRPYLINRQPYSAHLDLLEKTGFKLLCDIPIYRKSKIKRKNLAGEFQNLSEKDLNTRTTFIQAVKENEKL
ncbi:methyltransferase domain-containing protein, partial [Thermodesulfobacteriota bacterium]